MIAPRSSNMLTDNDVNPLLRQPFWSEYMYEKKPFGSVIIIIIIVIIIIIIIIYVFIVDQ